MTPDSIRPGAGYLCVNWRGRPGLDRSPLSLPAGRPAQQRPLDAEPAQRAEDDCECEEQDAAGAEAEWPWCSCQETQACMTGRERVHQNTVPQVHALRHEAD